MNEQGMLIIYRSPDGADAWEPVKTVDVPEWIKSPEVMGRIVNGEVCQNEPGSDWFMARYVMSADDFMIVGAAQEKRERKNLKRSHDSAPS